MTMFNLPQSHPGSWSIFGQRLPDWGVTEAIQRTFAPQAQMTAQGGSNIRGIIAQPTSNYAQQITPQQTPDPNFQRNQQQNALSQARSTSQVLGAQNVNPGSPNNPSGGSGNDPTTIQNPGNPVDQIGSQYDQLIQPAIQALQQAVNPIQQDYQTQVAQIGSENTQQAGTINQNLADQNAQIAANRNDQTTTSENAKTEARRGYNEISQGIQAKYGGTTGTGAFANEIAGSQTQNIIGQIQNNVGNALARLDDTALRVKQVHDQALQDLDARTKAAVQQAKSGLESNLNQIRLKVGDLMSQKAPLVVNAIQHYQDTLNQISQANAQYQQSLVLQHNQIQGMIDAYRQMGSNYIAQANTQNPTNYSFNQQTPVNQAGNTYSQNQQTGGYLMNPTDQTKKPISNGA